LCILILLNDSGDRTVSSAASNNELILKLLSDSPQTELFLKLLDGVADTIAEIYLSCSADECVSEFETPALEILHITPED
jgi:hypothetical protein